jgi:hypothetical protein
MAGHQTTPSISEIIRMKDSADLAAAAAAEASGNMGSREDWKKQKKLEEARKVR